MIFTTDTIFQSEFVSKVDKTVTLYLLGLDNHSEKDFSKIIIMLALCKAKLLDEKTYTYSNANIIDQKLSETFINLINECVQGQHVYNLPNIEYKGSLADEYTQINKQKEELSNTPIYQSYGAQLFNHAHFEGDFPKIDDELQILRDKIFALEQACYRISNKIQKELNVGISTIYWPRLDNNRWNYNLPATLTLEVYKHDEKIISRIEKLANEVINVYSVGSVKRFEDEQEWKLNIKLK